MPRPSDPSEARKEPLNPIERSMLQNEVIEALRTVYDPEIPVNIYDLGLVYEVEVSENADVRIVMTLTSPHCPVAESLPADVEMVARSVKGVGDVKVELTWDPPFTIDRIPEEIRQYLGLY
ncbi:MAG: iron-sulfur cluster assembly protein [Fimbriimonadales bacterium]|nr:iron-sulfur cluster assembly protein [Fimbriimonadales bacterium]